ncbi:hypothetical protein HGP14_08735 [Rhizobium sp. P32RR-XVIII]|jgi:hypothetical protein|nr:hypothetical protein [Rhizobium sp. P32RR-XVIII]NLS03453.1 hypothetical protein [Rhizobium sp. P32RR-XVIII]
MTANGERLAFIFYIAAIITAGCVIVIGALLAPKPDYADRRPAQEIDQSQ